MKKTHRGGIGRGGRSRGRPAPSRHLPPDGMDALPRERAAARVRPAHPDGGPARAVHRLSVRDGRVAVADQYERRQSRRLRRPAELPQGVERLDLPDRLLEHVLLHVLGDHLQADARDVARPLAQPALPRQADRARLHAPALHRADRAQHLRVAVDVRSHLQRAQLAALPCRLHHDQAPVPLRRHLWHVVRHRGQHVARHAVLRHHAARGAPDHQHGPAGGRRRSTAPTAGSASGT